MRKFTEGFMFDLRHGRETWRVLLTVSALGFSLGAVLAAF
jgi:hypothetical protein